MPRGKKPINKLKNSLKNPYNEGLAHLTKIQLEQQQQYANDRLNDIYDGKGGTALHKLWSTYYKQIMAYKNIPF